MQTSATPAQHTERPWHRRSHLYDREAEIRALAAEGYSLRQIIDRLDLRVSRSTLHRWLRRAAAARLAGEPASAVTPTAPGADEADDAAAETLLAATDFSPPNRPSRK